MFALTKTECTFTSVSTNPENMGKGGETRTGMSIYFEYIASNDALDMFDPKLRPSLYEAAISGQEDMTGFLPVPKFKLAKPIAWPYVGAGYCAEISPDLEFGNPIAVDDVKVDKFQFTIQDEGRVGFKGRIYLHPSTELIGPLCELAKHQVSLTLIPPKVSESSPEEPEEESPQQDLLDDVNNAETEVDVIYPRVVASVRAKGTTTGLQTEFKVAINQVALWLERMEKEGVIVYNEETEDYDVVAQAEAAA